MFFCSASFGKWRRVGEESFQFDSPRIISSLLAIRQFFSVHFILLRSLDFLIFYHSLAEWVKSPSLAVHLNFNNFCRPLCVSLAAPSPPSFILVFCCFLLRRINKWIQLFIRKTRANVDSLSFAIFQISSQTTQQKSRNQKQKKLSSCLYNHPEKYRRNIVVAFLVEGTHGEESSFRLQNVFLWRLVFKHTMRNE